MKDLLIQIKQRTDKLLEEIETLESLEFDYHTMCTVSDYCVIQDQKDLVEFLTLKLKNSLSMLGCKV